jgi:SNF2 family DNA or RNA helicase
VASRVDQERALLIQLQVEKDETEQLLAQEAAAMQKIMREHDEHEQTRQQLRQRIAHARAALALAEKREAADELTDTVDSNVERLNRRFEQIAEGKPWYEGIFPHQWQGMRFGAAARRFILGDGVGLGKTREAVGWLDLVGAKKVIIVCEANICEQFAGEVEELAPHREVVHLYNARPYQREGVKYSASVARHQLIDSAVSKDEAVLIVNFEMWRRDKDALAKLMMWQADTVIVDEAHNLKSTSTANYKNIEKLVMVDNVCGKCSSLIFGLYDPEMLARNPSKKVPRPCESCGWKAGDPTTHRTNNLLDRALLTRSVKNLCLTTGTPILNSPVDLYSLLHLCNHILFNTKSGFQTAYLQMHGVTGKWDFRSKTALDDLKPLIAGIFIARTLKDTGVVLPKQTVNTIPIEMDKVAYAKQYKVIRQLTDAAQIVLDSGKALTVMHLISLITRKRQANVWPGGIVLKDPETDEVIFDAGEEVQESIKMDTILAKMLEMHQLGHRQIVFSQFKTGLAEFEQRITAAGLRAARFDGDTPDHLRTEIKSNFDRNNHEEAKWDVVLANYKTGGTGLNFTEATVTHILDEEWNPGKRDQGYGRTNRIGQTEENHVFVYRIRGSIDTWMSNTIKRKESIVDSFNNTMTGEEELAMDLKAAIQDGSVM